MHKYARLLWTLHTVWALLSGVAVLVLAHNRHGFARWVVLFLALTWGSTLVARRYGGLAQGFASYLTRVMYQETLFFLIPFYFYSATFPSLNFVYVIALTAFAVLSCFDMLFDRLLREHRWFAVGFFAFVSFSALNFFLPLLLRTRIEHSELISAAVSFVAAFALANRWNDLREPRRLAKVALVFVAVLISVRVFRALLPPVPLRMTRLQIAGAINHRTLELSGAPGNRMYAVATVFSPERLPAQVELRFIREGKVLRTSRNVAFVAHRGGFRVWDSLRLPRDSRDEPIRIELWTNGHLLGNRTVTSGAPSR